MSGNSNTERVRGEPWSLLAVSTGNTSVIETISTFKNAPKAEAARLLETKAVKLFDETKTKHLTDKHQANSKSIFGHAGVLYMQHIMQNMDRVKALLKEIQRKVDTGAQLTAQDRYWSVGATVNIAGFLLAREIGLLNYDKEGFFRYALRLLEENRNSANDMISSTSDVLNDFVHEHWGSILKIKSTDDLRKGHDNGMDDLVIPEFDPRVRLVGRYETDVKKLYIVPKVLKSWCAHQQINYSSLIQDFKENFNGRTMKIRLTKGTPTQMPPSHVLCIDCSNVELEEDAET